MKTKGRIQQLITDWETNPRWKGVERPYTAEEVVTLQGSYQIEHSIARRGAKILWDKLKKPGFCGGVRSFNRKPGRARG
jgi:isocitrate lyase